MKEIQSKPQKQDSAAKDSGTAGKSTSKVLVKSKKAVKATFHWLIYTLPEMEWTKLLALPLIIATATSIITGQIQQEANKNAILKSYFEELEKLVFEQNLLPENNQPSNTAAVIIARGKTLVALRTLDLERRKQLIAFLQASNITKSTTTFKTVDDRPVLSFKSQDLSHLNLRETNLTRMDFYKTNLEKTDFGEAYMYGAFMVQASLSGANLRKADLRKTRLGKADLSNADFRGADLRGASLSRADFSNSNLSGADLSDTDLSNVNFSGANLKNANFSNAILAGTDFQNTQLPFISMTGEEKPYLCNPGFPLNDQTEKQDIDKNQDCEALPNMMVEEHSVTWKELEKAEQAIDKIRQKQWD